MKRNSLTTALLAGLAGAAGLATTANAVNLNPDGLGQVLIYPFYSVDGGNTTLVSVVNTTNRVKAVKVRFLEARNSKEVLDFNLYLSPFDVWTGAVSAAAATGPGQVATFDTSCTVPRFTIGVPVPFRNFEYTGANRDHPTATAAVLGSLDRTRQGHIEMIEMGLLIEGTAATQLADEATHTSAGVPVNCDALRVQWLPTGGWTANGASNIELPTGGLFGNGSIVDVAAGQMVAYTSEAIEGFYSNTLAPGALHRAPGTTKPDLRDADNGGGNVNSTIFANNGAAVITEVFPVAQAVPNPVSLVFMHDAIFNEYVTTTSIAAASEWVVTFPTKRFYVDSLTTATAPFTDPFRDDGLACEEISLSYYDREEGEPGTPPGDVDFSPPPPTVTVTGPAFCFEANILAFNQGAFTATRIFEARPTTGLAGIGSNITTAASSTVTFREGWARIGFDDPAVAGNQNVLTTPDGSQYFGLPVVGFWAADLVNLQAAPGLLANYNGTYRHRASRANSG